MRRWVKQLEDERGGELPEGSRPVTAEQRRKTAKAIHGRKLVDVID